MSAPARFMAELKRRKVFRVAAVYGATAFVVAQGADLVFPHLGLPRWTVTLVVALGLIGLPVAVALAWAFDATPEGVRREGAPARELAGISLVLGEREAALRLLQRAQAERDPQLVLTAVEPTLDPLRNDPRFIEILKSLRLPAGVVQ